MTKTVGVQLSVVVLGKGLPDSDDARFGLRLLQAQWPTSCRVLLGMALADALAVLPTDDAALLLWVDGPWVSPDARCLERLHAALADFAGEVDVAWACDSKNPAPMGTPNYATGRGMERFVNGADVHSVPVRHPEMGVLGLATVAGWRKHLAKCAHAVRVVGAWAHDASGYFGGERREVLPLLPSGMTYLLDVGGGEGGFLCAAKAAHPEVFTQLVELTPAAAALARTKPEVDAVWQGSFYDWIPTDRCDCISFLDVIEHLVDPERALLHARGLLAQGGSVVLSIPNVGHWSVVADLLEGRWDWAPAGIHCYTHVRFFTRRTIEDMLQRCGYVVDAWQAVKVTCRADWLTQWQTSGLDQDLDSLETYAYLLRAHPAAEGVTT